MSNTKNKLAKIIKVLVAKAVKEETRKIKRQVIQEVRKEIKRDAQEDETLNNVLQKQRTRDNSRAIVNQSSNAAQDPYVQAHGAGAVDPREGQEFNGPEDVQERLSEAQSNFRQKIGNVQSQARQTVNQQVMAQQPGMQGAQGQMHQQQAPQPQNNQMHDPSEISDRARQMLQNQGQGPVGQHMQQQMPQQQMPQQPMAGGGNFHQQLQQVTGNNPADVAKQANKGSGSWRPGK